MIGVCISIDQEEFERLGDATIAKHCEIARLAVNDGTFNLEQRG